MKSRVNHIQVNIDSKNLSFYKDLMSELGFTSIMGDENFAGFAGDNGASVWFMPAIKQESFDYDTKGCNHIGFGVDSVSDVDEVVSWLQKKNIPALFETPRHRTDFAGNGDETYYQVMFESPDKILLEVFYYGKK